MKPLPPANAELRQRFLPLRTWAALSVTGLGLTLVRNWFFDISLFPIRVGATPFLVLTLLGAVYAGGVMTWLRLRNRHSKMSKFKSFVIGLAVTLCALIGFILFSPSVAQDVCLDGGGAWRAGECVH